MSISATSLESAIKSKLEETGFKIADQNENFIKAISVAVVEEIKKADVSVTVAGGSSAGVHAGKIT